MGMVNVNARKTGKLLNTQRRRQQRTEQSSPYGRSSSSRGEKHESTGKDGGGESSPCQAASTIRGSGEGGGDDSPCRAEALQKPSNGRESDC